MAVDQFWLRTAAVTIDQVNDKFLLYQNASSSIKPISRNVALGITGAPVGTTDAQTLSSKILTSPTINGATLSGTLSGTYTIGGTPTFPSSVVTLTGTQVLTNKSLTAPAITGGTVSNASINVDSISGFSTSTIVTVGGVQMNNGTIGTSGAVTSTSVAVGAIQPQALVSGTGTGWSWQNWTPTLSNITLGNGTLTSKYIQIGKTVFFRFIFVLGSTSSIGTAPGFTLPVTAVSGYNTGASTPVGTVHYEHTGVGNAEGAVYVSSTTTASLGVWGAGGTYVTGGAGTVSAGVPFTFTTNDQILTTGFYEAA